MTESLTMTVPEAAKLLGIGRSAAYEAAARGELASVRVGRSIRIPRVAIERMLAVALQRCNLPAGAS